MARSESPLQGPLRFVRQLLTDPRTALFEAGNAFTARLLIIRAEVKTDRIIGSHMTGPVTQNFREILSDVTNFGPKDPKARNEWVIDHTVYLEQQLIKLYAEDELKGLLNQLTAKNLAPEKRTLAEVTFREAIAKRLPSLTLYTRGDLSEGGQTEANDTRIYKPVVISQMAEDLHRADVQSSDSDRRESRTQKIGQLEQALDRAFNRYRKAVLPK